MTAIELHTGQEVATVTDAEPHDLAIREAVTLEARYKRLAAELLHNEQMWMSYMKRCETIANVEMYGYKKAESVAIAGLKGFAMGWDLPAALERIKVIHGRPCIRGKEAVGLVRSRGFHMECVESTFERATWKCSRPGYTAKVFEYLRSKADKAGLPGRNDVWNKFPEELLKWACATMAVNEYFPDVLGGFSIAESYEDAIDVEPVGDTGKKQEPAVNWRRESAIVLADLVARRLVAKGIDAVAGEEAYNKEKKTCWDLVTKGIKLTKEGPTDEQFEEIVERCSNAIAKLSEESK